MVCPGCIKYTIISFQLNPIIVYIYIYSRVLGNYIVCMCNTNLYMSNCCCTIPFYATLLSLSWASKFRHINAVSTFTTVICFTPLTLTTSLSLYPFITIIKINFTCKYFATQGSCYLIVSYTLGQTANFTSTSTRV